MEAEITPLPVVEAEAGIDLRLHDVVVFDSGEKVGNPRFFQTDEKAVAKAQRCPTKKVEWFQES